MRGPAIDGIVLGVLVAIVLLATAHIWGRWLGRGLHRAWRNLTIAGNAIWRQAAKWLGQGQTRPSGRDY
jgi:hypothetical protein